MPNVSSECWFFTAATRERWPTFRDPYKVRALLSVLNAVRAEEAFENLAFVVLPDHVHGLWSMAGDADAFARRWTMVATALDLALRHPIFDPTPLARRIDSEGERIKLRAYIHFNPVRHGLVADANAWPYSTVRLLARHRREAA